MNRRLIIALLTFLILAPQNTLAQQKKENAAAVPEEASAQAEYKLPYPGMLPDSKLYKLKTFRDKLILFLIRDPYKKAEKYLNLADRMLYESLKLSEKNENKMNLAIHNAFKGEHNMTQLVNRFKQALYSGSEFNSPLAERAHKASVMHKKLLTGMKDRAKTEQDKKQFDIIIEFSDRNDKELYKLEKEATAEPELELESGANNPLEL